jgi:fructose-bisphosphate aldolase class I
LVAAGKGILAADETVPTLGKRFDQRGISSTAESRRTYREMLFTTPQLSHFVSGVTSSSTTRRCGRRTATATPSRSGSPTTG